MSVISGLARIAATVGVAEVPDSQVSMSEDLLITSVNPTTPQIDISSEFRKALRFFGFDKLDKDALEIKNSSASYNPFLSQISGSKSLLIFTLLAEMGDNTNHRAGCGYCSPIDPIY